MAHTEADISITEYVCLVLHEEESIEELWQVLQDPLNNLHANYHKELFTSVLDFRNFFMYIYI